MVGVATGLRAEDEQVVDGLMGVKLMFKSRRPGLCWGIFGDGQGSGS